MKRYTQEELNEILKKHQHWLNEDCENWEGMRADLSGTDLSGTDLSSADLSYANLNYANLSGADLNCTNLEGASLIDVKLRGANLRCVNLSSADLNCTNLRGVNLIGASLRNTNLYGVNLQGANLHCADLHSAKNIPFIPYACPDTGSFIGYKKAGKFIIELKILSDARRCSATERECRCDKAEVLSIQYLDKYIPCDIKSVASNYDRDFIYRVGEIVEEPNFDENRWNECTKGIHFFINRQEAVEY